MSLSKQVKTVCDDLMTTRQHPFYAEWTDWKEIALRYHSEQTKNIQRAINKGCRYYCIDDFNVNESELIDSIYFETGKFQNILETYGLDDFVERFYAVNTTFLRLIDVNVQILICHSIISNFQILDVVIRFGMLKLLF